MRINLAETNRPDKVINSVRNKEASASIPKGTPLILNLSSAAQPTTGSDGFAAGYEDGLQVVLPGTAGANPSANFPFGVALDTIPNGQLGESQVFGVVAYALVGRHTRAASTDSWTSSASSSLAGGFLLSIDTVNNCFVSFAASSLSGSASTTGNDPQRNAIQAIMLDSFPSTAASASNTSDTRTANITGYRVFVRYM